jgi:hypothetical protein
MGDFLDMLPGYDDEELDASLTEGANFLAKLDTEPSTSHWYNQPT